jgi:hypothetical protein
MGGWTIASLCRGCVSSSAAVLTRRDSRDLLRLAVLVLARPATFRQRSVDAFRRATFEGQPIRLQFVRRHGTYARGAVIHCVPAAVVRILRTADA